MSDHNLLVVGAGQAAASLVSRYRALGNTASVLLVGEEPTPPYQRPPLSKKYLLGELARERLLIRPQQWYDDQQVSTKFATQAASLDPQQHTVTTEQGETLGYEKLVLCTGSHARQLDARVGGQLAGVYTLRSLADIDKMADEFQPGRRLLIIGGGYIGLEAAAVARKLDLQVTLLEAAERILQRVAAPQTSDYFRALHQGHGVEVREAASLVKLRGEQGRVRAAELANGELLAADLVLVGIGGSPNSELAEAAGLTCDNGIAVNNTCQTSDPDIYAAGDCCSFMRDGQRLRLESVQNASDQGDLIARVLSGEDVHYHALPWFWSEQYDCRLQIAGLNQGYTDTVLRPGTNPGSQSLWYFRDRHLLAVDAMNDALSYATGRKILAAGIQPSPEQVADPLLELKSLL